MTDPSHLSRSGASRSLSAIGRSAGRISNIFAGSTSIRATGRFLRAQIWAWPIIAAVLFGGVGWWVHGSVEDAMRERRIAQLETVLNATVESLEVWMKEEEIQASLLASDEKVREYVAELLTVLPSSENPQRALTQAPAQAALRHQLGKMTALSGHVGYQLISPDSMVIAADEDPPLGLSIDGYREEFFKQVSSSGPSVSRPLRSFFLLRDAKGELRPNVPTMFSAAPIKDETGKVIAVLGLRIRPEDDFTQILQVARSGKTAETYAFDRTGLMLSSSRFDDELKEIGLLADDADSQSILTLQLRDPGVDMTTGARPAERRAQQPLTKMVQAAAAGKAGIDPDGYRDYRGVLCVGAWKWLPEHEFGVATEMDITEACAPLYIMRKAFWTLLGMLLLASGVIFVYMLFASRQQRALQLAVLNAKQLGQYHLETKLGSGGMGTVYRARHAMLRRPTAVKLIDAERMTDAAITRFEREVQHTSALTHPNTVAIYDYGRTPEGIFYYAMEYLDGADLDHVVKKSGPMPEARTVYLLRQVCGALAEAHVAGLVHRDIKPANIFLTARGGLRDFVKVLDFGLVKATTSEDQVNLTSTNAIIGTPLYLAPEAVQAPDEVDARADVYAIGAVAYFMLTGTPPFEGTTAVEICMKHVSATPQSVSERAGRAFDAELERLVMDCLAKSPAQRPADANALLERLEQLGKIAMWTQRDARQAWDAFQQSRAPNGETVEVPAAAMPSRAAAFDQTIVTQEATEE